jgi:hypothetical protein
MGADLYIRNMPREPQVRGPEVSPEAVEVGYFRDCYNAHGLFAFLGEQTGECRSWWRLLEERELFDGEGYMTPAGAAVLLEGWAVPPRRPLISATRPLDS